MATLNVSDKQKQRVIAASLLIEEKLGVRVSQATTVDMALAVLEDKYK